MNWKSIIATAVITGIVTIVTGMLLFKIQDREPELLYSVEESVPFKGQKETIAIHRYIINNNGDDAVKNVVADIKIEGAQFKQHKIQADGSLPVKEIFEPTHYRVEIESLNPSEKVTISLLVGGVGDRIRPTVSVRGDGIRGQLVKEKKDTFIDSNLIIALISAYAGIGAFLLYSKRYRKVVLALSRTIFSGRKLPIGEDQKHVIGSLFAIKGDVNEATTYLRKEASCTYWSEADLIGAKAVASDDENIKNKYVTLLKDLLTYANMAEESIAIIHYNIARILTSKGDTEATQEHLDNARKIDNEMVKKRLEVDPLFAKNTSNKKINPTG